jgi:RimJ/RimL family protein N-acetyltransferase
VAHGDPDVIALRQPTPTSRIEATSSPPERYDAKTQTQHTGRNMRQYIEADGFLLRPLVPNDAPAMAAAVRESMASLSQWMPWAHAAYDEADALAWIAACDTARADGSAHEFGIFRKNGQHYVGAAGLNQFNRLHGFCNLGYWVRTTARGEGAAVASIRALAQFAFEYLEQSRVEIVVAEGNLPSLSAARKAGADLECLARNRLNLSGRPVAAHMLSLCPVRRPLLKTNPSAPPPRWSA